MCIYEILLNRIYDDIIYETFPKRKTLEILLFVVVIMKIYKYSLIPSSSSSDFLETLFTVF